MNLEIERKFLVQGDAWRGQSARSTSLRQGYIANTGRCSVRLRIAGERAWLSVKAMRPGPVREEYEYEVPVGTHRFELDEFQGANRGLVLAEIELDRPDAPFPRPPWLGDEVTDDGRFHNFRLALQPFADWPENLQDAARSGPLAEKGPS